MFEFLEVFAQSENLHFTGSLMIFVGLMALLMLGFVGDGVDVDFELELDMDVDVADTMAGYPLICFLLPFFGFFGSLGLVSNWLLTDALDVTVTQKTVISTLLSAAVSYQLSNRFARLVGKLLPAVESYGLSNTDVAGCLAEILGEKMDSSKTVRISVTDTLDNMHTLRGQLMTGYDDVEHGGIVRIIKHDEESDICFCVPVSASIPPSPPSDSA
jgi:hypothetical protein